MLAVFPEVFKLQRLLTEKYCPWFLWWRRVCANLNKYPFFLCRNFRNCMRCKFGNVTHLQTSTCCVFNIQVTSSQQTPQNYWVLKLLNLIRAHKYISDHCCFKELFKNIAKMIHILEKAAVLLIIHYLHHNHEQISHLHSSLTFSLIFCTSYLSSGSIIWEMNLTYEQWLQRKKKQSWWQQSWFSETIFNLIFVETNRGCDCS